MSRAFAVVRTLAVGTIFLSIWLYWLPRWFAHLEGVSLAPRNPWGWALFLPGLALASWCAMEFALRGEGTPAPFDPPRRLVISGLYRWVRNPMYLGMALMLIGETILLPQIRREMAALSALLATVVAVLVVRMEEPALRRLFGEEFEEYCRQVPRWIPRLTPFDTPDPPPSTRS